MKRAGQAIAMLLPIAVLAVLGYFIHRPHLLGASPSLAFAPRPTATVTAGSAQRGSCGHEHWPAFYIGLAPGNDWQAKLNAFTAAGVRPSVIEAYVRFGTVFDWTRYCQITRMGAIPLIQLNPVGFSLAAIAGGHYDRWLRSYARSVRGFQHFVILSFAPEMNGDWYPWGYRHTSPAVFIAAWRHLHDLFAGSGARNVIWCWDVDQTGLGTHLLPLRSPIKVWWPGAAYVDWVGLDAYYRTAHETFDTVFGSSLASIGKITNKPVLIAETAVPPDGRRVPQIHQLVSGALHARGVIGIVWFDSEGNRRRQWRIDKDPAALAALWKGNS